VDEKDLVRECLEGKPEAWTELVRRYDATVRAAVESALRRGRAQAGDLDDVCQEIYASLMADGARMLRGFEFRASLKTWLCVVAASRALNHARRRRPEVPLEAVGAPTIREATEGVEPELVQRAMGGLAGRDRLLLEMAYRQEQPYKEIAEILGLSVNAVGPALTRAVARFKRCLESLSR
jgi:RNA polymerase sigma-70 factor (ECF subfamily)